MLDKKKFHLGAIVTVRSLSSRLEKKCYQKIFEDITLIEAVINRAKKINAKVIVATSEEPSDDLIEKIALNKDVSIFRGSLQNKIHRWYSCFEEYKLDYAMLVDADDPTFSFSLMNEALDKLSKLEVDIISSSENLLPGLLTYGISKHGIEKLYSTAKDYSTNTDVIDIFLQRANLKFLKIHPTNKEEFYDNIRLTIDYPEDLNFYREVYKGISYLETSVKIIKFIKDNNFAKINWFRNSDFKQNQKNFNEKII
tara:strand:+ start:275 stop:1036 length:762 start_codon:yes stop_codon:yes gene_type:complete